MSGICGFLDFDGAPAAVEILRQMAEGSAYLGPDGIRYHVEGPIAFAHLALHTTKESAKEVQPLSGANGGIRLIADARLDNRGELKAILRDEIKSDAPSDAELILAGYQRWGENCPEHFLGDFAITLWDLRRNRLFCASDPLGIKPIYYSKNGAVLCFASQPQQILAHPAVSPRLDELTIGNYLCNVIEDPRRTFFHEVRRLPPAHRLVARRNEFRIERYWDVDPERQTRYHKDEEYVAHFRELFQKAVADRLRISSGDIGIAMSGGLDSCSVAAVALEHLRKKTGSPKLFATSFVFDELSHCDERTYISAMASELGLEVLYVEAEHFWILQDEGDETLDCITPPQSYEALLREMLRRLREKNVRVFLTGNGGDEVAGGSLLAFADRLRRGDLSVFLDAVRYSRWRRRSLRRVLYHQVAAPLLPPWFDRSLRRLIGRRDEIQIPEWICQKFISRTGLAERIRQKPARRRFQEKARQEIYDSTVGKNGHLFAVSWYDRIVTRFGMEPRYPFLDRRLIEYVLSVPHRQLFRIGDSKHLLRRAIDGVVPKVVQKRPGKTNLSEFVDFGMQAKEAERIERLLQSPLMAEMGIVDGGRLKNAYRRYRASSDGVDRNVFFPIAVELWLRKINPFFFRRTKVETPTENLASVSGLR